MEQFKLQELLSTTLEWIKTTGPVEWVAAGGGLIILALMISLAAGKRRKKKRAKRIAPKLILETFQISPLGRDAYFKVQNIGQTARLHLLQIKGRNDIVVKNAIAGHDIMPGESYRILLEASGGKKLANNFTIELSYLDQLGNVYRQLFSLSQQAARQPRLVKFA